MDTYALNTSIETLQAFHEAAVRNETAKRAFFGELAQRGGFGVYMNQMGFSLGERAKLEVRREFVTELLPLYREYREAFDELAKLTIPLARLLGSRLLVVPSENAGVFDTSVLGIFEKYLEYKTDETLASALAVW